MYKKVFAIILLFGLTQIVFITCSCPDRMTFYNRIINIEAANCNLHYEITDSTVINQNDFRIRLKIYEETFAHRINQTNFINSAYALSCEEDIYAGLNNDIIEFFISCSNEILNTIAGEPIEHSYLSVYRLGFSDHSKNQRWTVQEWINIMNNGGEWLDFKWYFEFNDTINSDDYLKFEIRIKQEDGTEFEMITNTVKIK